MLKKENLQWFTNKNYKVNMRIHGDNRSFPLSPSPSIYVYIQIYRNTNTCWSCSVSQSCLTLLRLHGMQHISLPCPSPVSRGCSDSYPLSQWCHPTVSSSVVPFFSRLQSFPASGSFPMSQFFTLGGQKYWNFSFSISPSNEYSGLISFRRTGWISLQSEGLSSLSNTTVQKHQFFGTQLSLWPNSHIHIWLREKPLLWLGRPLLAK